MNIYRGVFLLYRKVRGESVTRFYNNHRSRRNDMLW